MSVNTINYESFGTILGKISLVALYYSNQSKFRMSCDKSPTVIEEEARSALAILPDSPDKQQAQILLDSIHTSEPFEDMECYQLRMSSVYHTARNKAIYYARVATTQLNESQEANSLSARATISESDFKSFR